MPVSSDPTERPHETAQASAGGNSYSGILKSTAIIGGSSFVNIAVSAVRAKAMALLIGPAGVGLVGLFSSVLDLSRLIVGMGLRESGVRQIAEAVGSGDDERVARTAAVLRLTTLFLGLVGSVGLFVFSHQVAVWTFGAGEYANAVRVLSVAVALTAIADGQAALLQGTRRISDLARISIWVTFLTTPLSLWLVYVFRERAIVPMLVSGAIATAGFSWWYARKVKMPARVMSARDVWAEAPALMTLGVVLMVSGVLSSGAAYLIRVILRDNVGLHAAGLYQSAWSLGGLYVGFILQALGTDFFPRLTAVRHNHEECNRLVNEQAHVSLLLAGPGLLGTLSVASLVITLFYSSQFQGAVEPLRWICLGMALRVICWPMAVIVLATGHGTVVMLTEIAAQVIQVSLAFFLVGPLGLRGVAMAFFLLYVWHGLLLYGVVRYLTGFSWSAVNRRAGLLYLTVIGAVFSSFFFLPAWLATTVGVVSTIVAAICSARELCQHVPLDRLPLRVRRLLAWLRISQGVRPIAPALTTAGEV